MINIGSQCHLSKFLRFKNARIIFRLFAHADDPDIDEPFEAPKGHVLSESTETSEGSKHDN